MAEADAGYLHTLSFPCLDGLDVVDMIEGVGSQSGTTAKPVMVRDCGEITE
jgi:hypothetical protein